jgi:hypothetical protein
MSLNSSPVDEIKAAPSLESESAECDESPICFRDVAPALEFSCWVLVALAPPLRLVNGAAVTADQFVIQVTLVSMALAGAIGLRIYNWRIDRRENLSVPRIQSHRQ